MSKVNELNVRVFIISALLTVLLAISNTYLALKVGLLTAASIPAAVLSMGIMKFLRESTVFEHNLVQTAASSGEAVAGGIVYTIPGLIVIGFWDHFPYWQSVIIILLSGALGVFFSAMIRRPLLADKTLRFPEGRAIAEVLRLKEKQVLGFKELLGGAFFAALIEFLQSTNLAWVSVSKFFIKGASLFGFGVSFAPALVGAGFIIGVRVGLSLFLGALVSYLILLPILSHGGVNILSNPEAIFNQQFAMDVRFAGVGAMLVAALITLVRMLVPLIRRVKNTFGQVLEQGILPEHDQDLSKRTLAVGTLLALVLFYFLLTRLFNLSSINFPQAAGVGLVVISVVYVLVIGFVLSVVCGYFSGLVGVSSSPGSSVMILGMIISTLLIHIVFTAYYYEMSNLVVLHGEAIAIIIGTIVMSIACIANDTFQDLKVGQILRASPKKQQIMLLFGVFVAAFIIPWVMQVLYDAYGFVGHMPRANMNPNNALAIPPAAVMAALTQAIFNGDVPWHTMSIGAMAMLIIFLVNHIFLKRIHVKAAMSANADISLLAVGIGMYLPLSSSTALVVGSLLALVLQLRLGQLGSEAQHIIKQKKLLMACGLVAGATLMDVILAVPIALNPTGKALSFVAQPLVVTVLGFIAALLLFGMLVNTTLKKP